MNIIIAGGGKVGKTLLRQLTAEGHDLTLIDRNAKILSDTVEDYDLIAVSGNCATRETLISAGIMDADLLIAVTGADETNLLCAMTAHGLRPNLHTIARIRNPEYSEQVLAMPQVFPLSLTVNPEKRAANEIRRLLRYPGFLRRDTFAKGRTEIVELRIERGSKLCDVRLMDMAHVVGCKVLVCAVLRGGQAIAPTGPFQLHEGDRIFVTAPSADLSLMLSNLGIVTRRVRRVLLCGGGRISYYLAKFLSADNIRVTIVEKEYDRCVELAALLPDATIIHGDCSDQTTLDEQDIDRCDALVALTGVDETNMILSLYANSRKVPQIITKLSRSENSPLADTLSLGSVIYPKEHCSNDIVRYVRAMGNQQGAAVTIHTIADGQAEAVEFLVDETTKFCNTPLKDLKLRPNVLIASITRGTRSQVPGGDSVFHRGDTVVVVTSGRGILHTLNDIFA